MTAGTKALHVCIVTSAHPLDDVRVNSKMAASFVAAGCRVSWAGPEQSYFRSPQDRDPRIEYHLTAPTHTKVDRIRSAARVARVARSLVDVDWYYVPDPDMAQVMARLAHRQGARLVFDIHEVFHGALLDRWLYGHAAAPVREVVRRRIARTCAASDLVVGVNRSVLEPYVPQGHGLVVRNTAPSWFAETCAAAEPPDGAAGAMTFVHGKALANNGTPVLLAALADTPDLVQVLMFPGTQHVQYLPDLDQRLDASGVRQKVLLHPPVAHEQMPAVLAGAQVGIIGYGRGLGRDSLPNRIFEYMAAGLAVLVPSYAAEMCRIVSAEDIGRTADFEDPSSVAAAMRWFVENPQETVAMGRRARTAFLERHSWDVEFDRMLGRMTQVAVGVSR